MNPFEGCYHCGVGVDDKYDHTEWQRIANMMMNYATKPVCFECLRLLAVKIQEFAELTLVTSKIESIKFPTEASGKTVVVYNGDKQ